MKDTQGTTSIQEMLFTAMFWIGITIHHHLMLLVYGHIQEEEVMKKKFPLIGIGDMRNNTLIHIMRWITFVIMRLIHFRNLINFEIAIAVLIAIVILDLTGLQGLVDVIVMITRMMISTIGPVLPIKTGRRVVKGIMTMADTVMILIMTEVVGEIAIGGVVDLVNLVTESVRRNV